MAHPDPQQGPRVTGAWSVWAAEQVKTIREIRESTVNSLQRPMRYDLDDVSDDAVGEVKALVETIGAGVREDRVARRAGDQALAGRLDELAVRLDRQDAIAAKHHPEDP
ncbi:hypothetical protein WKY82_01710 [Gordonia malaquae]|uniref:hypothetical protein n=1 Tax=Gordonia malaquae TaxID=410332 RepID=UPI0030C79D1C